MDGNDTRALGAWLRDADAELTRSIAAEVDIEGTLHHVKQTALCSAPALAGPEPAAAPTLFVHPSQRPIKGSQRQFRRQPVVWLGAAAMLTLLVAASLMLWPGGAEVPATDQATSTSLAPTTTNSPGTAVAGARTVAASNPRTGVAAIITMEPESAATKIKLVLRGLTGPLQCQVIAISMTGQNLIVSTWTEPDTRPGGQHATEPTVSRVHGEVRMNMEQIERFDIRCGNSPDLLVVPAT